MEAVVSLTERARHVPAATQLKAVRAAARAVCPQEICFRICTFQALTKWPCVSGSKAKEEGQDSDT